MNSAKRTNKTDGRNDVFTSQSPLPSCSKIASTYVRCSFFELLTISFLIYFLRQGGTD